MELGFPTLSLTIASITPQEEGGNYVVFNFTCKKCGRESISVPAEQAEIRSVYCLGCFTIHCDYDELVNECGVIRLAAESMGAGVSEDV